MLITSFNVAALQLDNALLDAIEFVESNANPSAVGDGGKSIGSFQITKAYVDDVNRIYNKRYTHKDRHDRQKSRQMTILYLLHYGRLYERETKKEATYEILSRIHNGGPRGMYKDSTLPYWFKVKNRIHAIR